MTNAAPPISRYPVPALDAMPEDIREKFGASKKAFKQAVGALYRDRKIRLTKPGIELLSQK